MKEVYIGNGVTIFPEKSEHFKIYDYDKINKYLKKYGKVTVGMKVDWYFTATEIDKELPTNEELFSLKIPLLYDDNINPEDGLTPFKITGIIGSVWDTPSIEVNGEIENCYIEVDKIVDKENDVWYYKRVEK